MPRLLAVVAALCCVAAFVAANEDSHNVSLECAPPLRQVSVRCALTPTPPWEERKSLQPRTSARSHRSWWPVRPLWGLDAAYFIIYFGAGTSNSFALVFPIGAPALRRFLLFLSLLTGAVSVPSSLVGFSPKYCSLLYWSYCFFQYVDGQGVTIWLNKVGACLGIWQDCPGLAHTFIEFDSSRLRLGRTTTPRKPTRTTSCRSATRSSRWSPSPNGRG